MNRNSFYGLVAAVSLCLLVPRTLSGQEVLLTVTGLSGEFDFGRVSAPVGDFNADGKSDILISATAIGNPPRQILRVYDDAGTVLMSHLLSLNEYTSDVTGLGDVSGDGTPDFAYSVSPAVTSGSLGGPLATQGDVVVVSGATGSEIRRRAGRRVARAGDIDGDGVMDVLTSDPLASTAGLLQNGAVYVYSGANGNLIQQVDGPFSSLGIGTAVSELGDVTGDAIPDYMFGIDPVSVIPSSTHMAFVVSGATGAIVTSYAIPSVPSANLPVGSFLLAGGRDVDSDGTNDIVMALSTDGPAGTNTGVIRVVSGATGTILHDLVGLPCEGLGDSIALGDVNSDGYADIVQGNFVDTHLLENECSVVSGLTGEIMISSAAGAMDVQHADVAGDFNGDGYEDFMLMHRSTGNFGVHDVVVVSGGPALGSTADTMVGTSIGQPEDVLKVNGETGGQVHCVGCALGAPITLSMDQPATNGTPAHFVIFARFGVPMGDETYVVPGVNGDMAVIPAPLVPWAIPSFFTFVSSVGPMPGGQVVLSGPAPWSLTIPGGIGVPLELTLEGVIIENSTTVSKTNAVIIRVH